MNRFPWVTLEEFSFPVTNLEFFLSITQLGNAFVAVPVAGLCIVLCTSGRTRRNALIAAAVANSKTPLPASGRGKLTIRSISAKQKPRRKSAK